MLEKFVVFLIAFCLLVIVAASTPEIKAEKPPEVVEPVSRMKLVETATLGFYTSVYLISVDNKEYLVCSSRDGGINMMEVTK
jgi:flagellar biogenesis protein FliO